MPPDLPVVRIEQPSLETDDPVYYPVEDDMGETFQHLEARTLLLALLADYLRSTRIPAFVGSDQFFYYQRGNPRAAVSPDLYILDDEPYDLKPTTWKVWEHAGKVPTLALEIVSDTYKKDYADDLLDRYERLGVRELLRFDPQHADHPRRKLLAHFLRDDAGRLIEQPIRRDRIRSLSYDVWFVHQPDDTLRIATGPDGSILWPTETERRVADTARAQAAESRAQTEAARARTEAARADAAEAARAALEAELIRLRGP